MYIYVCVCIYIYIYIYIHTHAYKHWCLYSSIASNKAFFRWWHWVQTWFQSAQAVPQVFAGLTSLWGIPISMLIQSLILVLFYLFPLFGWRMSKISQEYWCCVAKETLASNLDTLLIQPFLTHSPSRSSYFSNLLWCAQSKFLQYIYIYIYTNIHLYVYVYVGKHTCKYFYTHKYIYIYIYIYAHIS